jgi:hypothetical protein
MSAPYRCIGEPQQKPAEKPLSEKPILDCISHQRSALSRLSRLLVGSLALTIGSAAIAADAPAHNYTVTVDYSMSQLWVEARFSHPVDSVTARARDAAKYLVDVRGCDDTSNIKLRNQRMLLPDDGISCLNYTVDLARAAKDNRQNKTLTADNVIVSSSIWLWRPELTNGNELHVRFRLPEGSRVSVPWQPIDTARNLYRLRNSPESSHAPVAFGNFSYRELVVPGATLRVSIMSADDASNEVSILDWLQATATDVSLAYGRFPNPLPQVLVVPVGNSRDRSDGAVPFGQVIRDGGETVQLYINQNEPLSAFLSDWTATHEFSHLLLPFVDRRHKWISEGFAQYYQNILLARSGAYEEQYAWQKIHDGLERGRLSRPELSPNEAADGNVRTGLMKIYWSGAAIALMADVSLRELSDGRESLDTVLDRLQSCCLPSDRLWSGPELFAKLDTLTDYPVFMSLYRRYADTAGFPDTSGLFDRLGMTVSDGKVKLRKSGELRDIRLAIVAPDTETAQWRDKLVSNQSPQR